MEKRLKRKFQLKPQIVKKKKKKKMDRLQKNLLKKKPTQNTLGQKSRTKITMIK